jgi:hypothetical protein
MFLTINQCSERSKGDRTVFHYRKDTGLPSASQNTVREHGYMHTGLPRASQNTVREHGYMHTGLPSASRNTVREHGYMHTGLPSASQNSVREHGYMHSGREDDSTHTNGKTWMRTVQEHGFLSWRNHAAYIQSLLIQ